MVSKIRQQRNDNINAGLSCLTGRTFGVLIGIGTTWMGLCSLMSAHAQVQRHPRIVEAREAIATTLPGSLAELQQREAYRTDSRTQEEQEFIKAFVEDWHLVSPNTALFLGEWSSSSSNGAVSTWSIYPSAKAGGRVCVLRQRRHPETEQLDYLFGVGHLVTPSAQANTDESDFIYQLNVTGDGFSTAFQRITLTDVEEFASVANTDLDWNAGNVLAEVTVQPRTDELLLGALSAFPRPLSEPDFGPPSADREVMRSTYAAAGCTTESPRTWEWRIQSLPLAATQTLADTPSVTLQLDGAYVPVSDTGDSVEVYWTINNQSDRNVAIQPLNIHVETATEEEIECPTALERFRELVSANENAGCARGYLDPWQDGFLAPGDSVSGRVVILRQPDELDGLFLVVPDSFTGGLQEFRIPIQ